MNTITLNLPYHTPYSYLTDYDESSTDDGTSSEDDSDNRHRERRQRVAMYSHLSNRENKISQAPENHPSQTGILYIWFILIV